MSADGEDALTEWIRETTCLYQKGLRDYRNTQKRTRLWAKKAAEMDMTGDFLISIFFYIFKYFINILRLF